MLMVFNLYYRKFVLALTSDDANFITSNVTGANFMHIELIFDFILTVDITGTIVTSVLSLIGYDSVIYENSRYEKIIILMDGSYI